MGNMTYVMPTTDDGFPLPPIHSVTPCMQSLLMSATKMPKGTLNNSEPVHSPAPSPAQWSEHTLYSTNRVHGCKGGQQKLLGVLVQV